MPEAIELLPPAEATPNNPRWHELRREGITASEIAIVMGISKWGSPFSLYWQKLNGWGTEANSEMSTGTFLEPAIADWWAGYGDPLENLAMLPAGLYAHPDRPWQLATPDRLLFLACDGCEGQGWGFKLSTGYTCVDCEARPPVALLECKWAAYDWEGWGEPGTDEIPVYYRAQGLWQADTLGVDMVYFCALGPGGFRPYVLRIDDKAEADLVLMRAAAADMVRRLAEQDPPDLDGHAATLGALKKLHPSVGLGDVDCPVELAERYRIARADKKDAEQRVDQCEAEIRALLGSDFNRAVVGKKLVASRSVYDQAGDSAELTALEDDWPVVDRLNPGRAESYA